MLFRSGPRTSESAAAEGSAEDSAGEGAPQDEDELARQQEKELGHTRREALRRIRRELGRSISAARTRNPIESIYVCGLSLHGLVDAEVMDIPVQTLNAFGQIGRAHV